jgi:hypothetical protein
MGTAALVFDQAKLLSLPKWERSMDLRWLWLWIVVAAILFYFMMIFTVMASIIRLATLHSLLALIREKWGKSVFLITGICLR